jgi:hypothetical protein
LVVGFIQHFGIVTASNSSAIANSHTQEFTTARTKSSQSAMSSPVSWQQLKTANVPLPLGSRNVPVPELPASHRNSSKRPNCNSPLTRFTPLYLTALHSLPKLSKVKVTLRLTVSQSVSLGVEPHLGLMTRYLLLFDSYGLVFVGCPI